MLGIFFVLIFVFMASIFVILLALINTRSAYNYQFFKGDQDSECKFENESSCSTSIVPLTSGQNTNYMTGFSEEKNIISNVSLVNGYKFLFKARGTYKISYSTSYFMSGGGYSTSIQTYFGKLINNSLTNPTIIIDSISLGHVKFPGDYQTNNSTFSYEATCGDQLAMYIKYLNITDIGGPIVYHYPKGNNIIIEKIN